MAVDRHAQTLIDMISVSAAASSKDEVQSLRDQLAEAHQTIRDNNEAFAAALAAIGILPAPTDAEAETKV